MFGDIGIKIYQIFNKYKSTFYHQKKKIAKNKVMSL